MDKQLVAFASNAFDIEQGSVPDKDSLSKVRNISENLSWIRVICLIGYSGEYSSDSTPRHQQSSDFYKETRAGDSGVSAVLFLFLMTSVSVLANYPSLWQKPEEGRLVLDHSSRSFPQSTGGPVDLGSMVSRTPWQRAKPLTLQ